MVTIKAYTDLSQSKILSKILPLESADAFYPWRELMKDYDSIYVPEKMLMSDIKEDDILAWSLAALLDVFPNGTDIVKEEADTENEKYMCTVGVKDDIISTFGNNPVDACYEMILKLHELNLL